VKMPLKGKGPGVRAGMCRGTGTENMKGVAPEEQRTLVMDNTLKLSVYHAAVVSVLTASKSAKTCFPFHNNHCLLRYIFHSIHLYTGPRGSVVVKALCYKPEGRWFDTRCDDI
jgi:hypothetical protein